MSAHAAHARTHRRPHNGHTHRGTTPLLNPAKQRTLTRHRRRHLALNPPAPVLSPPNKATPRQTSYARPRTSTPHLQLTPEKARPHPNSNNRDPHSSRPHPKLSSRASLPNPPKKHPQRQNRSTQIPHHNTRPKLWLHERSPSIEIPRAKACLRRSSTVSSLRSLKHLHTPKSPRNPAKTQRTIDTSE